MRPSVHFALWIVGLAKAETQTTEAERACLAKHATGRKNVVEIGTWHGVTTCRLRAAMARNGDLYAVDPYAPGRLGLNFQELIAHREVGKVGGGGRVHWVRMTGAQAARAHVEKRLPLVDFLFIDGDHTYEGLKADWEGWSPLVGPAGIIALHDSHPAPWRKIERAGSVRYTEEVIIKDHRYNLLEVVDSLTVLAAKGANKKSG